MILLIFGMDIWIFCGKALAITIIIVCKVQFCTDSCYDDESIWVTVIQETFLLKHFLKKKYIKTISRFWIHIVEIAEKIRNKYEVSRSNCLSCWCNVKCLIQSGCLWDFVASWKCIYRSLKFCGTTVSSNHDGTASCNV